MHTTIPNVESVTVSDFLPYLLVVSASTYAAFLWQTIRYVREADLTRKSRLPFGTYVLTIINVLSFLNYASVHLAYKHYVGTGQDITLGDNLDQLHWGLRAMLAFTSTILFLTQLQSLILAKHSRAWNSSFAAELFVLVGALWVWDLRAAYGIQSFNISTIREWFLYHVGLSGFVLSFLFVTMIVSRLFEMHLNKSCDEQIKFPLTSFALDRCSLQYGEVSISNTGRTLSYLSGMLRVPSLLWFLVNSCIYFFGLNDQFGVFVLHVVVSIAAVMVLPVILVKGLRRLGDVDWEAKGVAIAERELKIGRAEEHVDF